MHCEIILNILKIFTLYSLEAPNFTTRSVSYIVNEMYLNIIKLDNIWIKQKEAANNNAECTYLKR